MPGRQGEIWLDCPHLDSQWALPFRGLHHESYVHFHPFSLTVPNKTWLMKFSEHWTQRRSAFLLNLLRRKDTYVCMKTRWHRNWKCWRQYRMQCIHVASSNKDCRGSRACAITVNNNSEHFKQLHWHQSTVDTVNVYSMFPSFFHEQRRKCTSSLELSFNTSLPLLTSSGDATCTSHCPTIASPHVRTPADMGQNAAQNNSMHFYHFFRVPSSWSMTPCLSVQNREHMTKNAKI